MATPISRDILNKETNARFWAQTGYKPGQRLDPKNPLDKAKMPVWMDIFRKVTADADAGTLVTTYDRPEVAQPLSDAEVAITISAVHIDAGAKAPDPTTAQQHAAAAATAAQVSSQKLSEAAANQPPTVSPRLEEISAREAAKSPPPSHAPAIDHIAHAQTQVPKPAARPTPPPEILYKETNARFWNRTGYKPGQKLDMTDSQDRKMSKTWMDILRQVQREANEGRLTFTSPERVPTPNGVRPPPPRPTQPAPPMRPPAPPMQQPMGPMRPPMRPPAPPMQQPMGPQMGPMGPMQQPTRPPMGPMGPMQQPMGPMRPPMRPMGPPGAPRPDMPMQPGMQPGMPTGAPPFPMEGGPPPFPTEGATTMPTEGGPPATDAPAEAPVSKGKIALIVLGLAGAAGVAYAVTRTPVGRTVSFRPRAKSTMAATGTASSAFPPRGGRS